MKEDLIRVVLCLVPRRFQWSLPGYGQAMLYPSKSSGNLGGRKIPDGFVASGKDIEDYLFLEGTVFFRDARATVVTSKWSLRAAVTMTTRS